MSKKPIYKIYTIISIVFAFCALSQPAEAVRVWAVGESHKINPATGRDFNTFVEGDISANNYIWDSGKNTVILYGAKNEYVGFQVIIEAKDRALKDVTVTFSELNGPGVISNNNIELYKEHYTNVVKKSAWPLPSTGTGEYPDALIPFKNTKFGAPFSIPKNRNQAVWVDVYVPKDIQAGEYSGTLSVLVSGKPMKSINTRLNVWDFTLPDENHLIFWSNYGAFWFPYGYKRDDPRCIDIERSIWKIAHEHRLNALLRHAHIRPKVRFNEYGQLTMDYSLYADRLKPYLGGTLFGNKLSPDIFLLPLSGGTEYRWPQQGPIDDPDATFTYACKDFAAYFREMGWGDLLDRCYIYLSDEPKPNAIDKIVHDAKLIHAADKDLKTMVALYKVFSPETVKRLSGSVDIWLVDASYYDSKLLLPRKRLGEKVGFYQQSEPFCGNESLDSDGLAFRTWPWIAWKYDVDCTYLYHMTIWRWQKGDKTIWEHPQNQTWSNSQGVLLYPGSYIGTDEVVGSIRLKQVRRGMQDYEYMYLARLKGANPDSIVDSIIIRALDETKRSAGNYGEWSHNPEDWFIARKNLASLILGEQITPAKTASVPKLTIKQKIRQSIGNISLRSEFRNGLKRLWLRMPNRLHDFVLSFIEKMKGIRNSGKNVGKAWSKETDIGASESDLKKQIKITVYPQKEKGRISDLLYGSNLCPKSESDRKIWDFVKNTGITCFRFPGGGSPGWHWNTGTADFNEKVRNMPLGRVDYLIKFCNKTDTKLIMQVNLETGTPEEAASLVEYLNKKAGFRVDYWELGNEVHGEWDKAHTSPENYARLIREYALAMKAADPTVKIGANWGGEYYDKVNWDRTVIRNAADYIDFISIHWYPNHINARHAFEGRIHPQPEEVMGNSMEIQNIVKRFNRIVEQYAPHRKGKIEVAFLEWDGSWDAPSNDGPPYSQNRALWSLTNAIFYADSLGQFAENGVTVATHYMLQECMFGLIRGWDPGEGWGGQQWDKITIRPKAFAIELFSEHFGDILIESDVQNSPYYYKAQDWHASSYIGNVPYVTCYASKFSDNGKLGVIFINKHPKETFDIEVVIDGHDKSHSVMNSWILTGPDITAQNDGSPRKVAIYEVKPVTVGERFRCVLPAHSVIATEIDIFSHYTIASKNESHN